MNIQSPCKILPGARLKAVHDFLSAHPHLLSRLPKGTHDSYLKICGAVSHLMARRATEFFIQILRKFEDIEGNPSQSVILRAAIMLSAANWTMVRPYFTSVQALPQDDEIVEQWTLFVLALADWNIETAITFLEKTPAALETFGLENLFIWGDQAKAALQKDRRMYKAAKAYLEEAVADLCNISLPQWQFLLGQSVRIAKFSPSAAEAFIKHGNRVCLLLNDQETAQWIAEGLAGYQSEEELINFFNGTSQSALNKRDGLVSGIALKDRSNTLSLICEACLGQPLKIRSNSVLREVKGFTGGAATDGHTIFLPDVAPDFMLYKLMALHQTMLLNRDKYFETSGNLIFDPIRTHIDADRRLLKMLPGLRREMEHICQDGLPPSYPFKTEKKTHFPLPWWGDLLPELVSETASTIEKIKERASEYAELPPELVESLLASMMANGQREIDGLWGLFKEMMDQMEFASPDPEELQENVKTYFYKEWDDNLSDYKLDWCLVRQRLAKADENAFVEKVRSRLEGMIKLIRRQFLRLKPERFRKYKAQPIGDGLDIDALVEAVVDMRSGAFLSENVYIRRDKRIRDVAVLFLVDMSSSTEEKVDGQRVIDIQKEAMVLMAEALDALEDPYAIYGFSSDGRFRVDLFGVKDFTEPYSDSVRYRLGNLEPLGLTRMGAVIRHACHKLESVPAAVKLMIILTDGRPYDLEYGVLDYAVADTKKAIQETRRKRIHPFIITSDKKGEEYLKRISPQTGSIILPKVELLPQLLPAIYKRLTV